MPNIIHITDSHFDHIVYPKTNIRVQEYIKEFATQVKQSRPLCVVMTGDISDGNDLISDLTLFQTFLGEGIPTFYVHGNHDFYNSSFKRVIRRSELFSIDEQENPCEYRGAIKWLGMTGEPVTYPVIHLTDKTCLIGDDGWYDLLAGDAENSKLQMNDFYSIEEFEHQPHQNIVWMSRKMATEGAQRVETLIRKAVLQGYKTVYLATHVPPFVESSLGPDRKQSNDTWASYMVNVTLGNKLKELAQEFQEIKIHVLAGHTHSESFNKIFENLNCTVGKADYGNIFSSSIKID